jgi:CheY-like chemotaxis protein
MKVLVVDDDETQRESICAVLRAAGNEVVVAADGAQALTLSREDRFDLVMMDLRMPGQGGLETAQQIRTLAGARGQVPIVAMSSAPPPPDHAIIPPLDGFVDKRLVDLPAKLAEILGETIAANRAKDKPARDGDSVRLSRAWAGVLIGLLGTAATTLYTGSWYLSGQAATLLQMRERVAGLEQAAEQFHREFNAAKAARDEIIKRLEAQASDDAHDLNAFRAYQLSLHDNIVDIDRRLNEQAGKLNDARREADASLQPVREDIAVLKAQFHFLADHTTQPPLPASKAPHP